MRDLVVLCPDIAWQATLEALLARHENLNLPRRIDVEVVRVPGQTDGGVRTKGATILRYYRSKFHRALLILDWSGCGDHRPAEVVQKELDVDLSHHWGPDGRAIVVDPEIETWIIGGYTHFNVIRGLTTVNARDWLAMEKLWVKGASKPFDPKEAIESLFSAHGARKNSANYRKIAERASLDPGRCLCLSYQYFYRLLSEWFGPAPPALVSKREALPRRR